LWSQDGFILGPIAHVRFGTSFHPGNIPGSKSLMLDSHLRFASGASIKLLRHNTDSYSMLRIWDASNEPSSRW
jgi:hypothetical protein